MQPLLDHADASAPPTRPALPRRLAIRFVRGYQRHVSGRGPLRQVHCSFEGHESCSHYGLRALREQPTLRAAVKAIHRRLRRCREAALYRQPDGALGWGPLYQRGCDDLTRFTQELDDARELPTTRRALLLGVSLVATRRGTPQVGSVALREAARCGAPLPPNVGGLLRPNPGVDLPLLRDGGKLRGWLLARTLARLAVLLSFCVLAALAPLLLDMSATLTLSLMLGSATLALGLSALVIRDGWRRYRRVDDQAWRQRFAGLEGDSAPDSC